LIALSVLDHFILSFAEEFLPVANAKGVATIGMKVLGMRVLSQEVERSLRYAFSLPVSTVIVGMETMEQLEQNLSIAENFVPMTDEERLALFRDVLPLVKPENLPWKVPDWDDPVDWIPRNRGR
jgi:aryl-alcohol dehydrogenase-like predicted oxidoreductase